MPGTDPFDRYWREYDAWYDKHKTVYTSELEALRSLLPEGQGLEVGVGTGRFAGSLATRYGLDPALPMLQLACRRGITVIQGKAEALPFKEGVLDYATLITALPFLENLDLAFREIKRILKPGGNLVIGMIDYDSAWGKYYQTKAAESPFYRKARFVSVTEVFSLLEKFSFQESVCVQTLKQPPPNLASPELPEPGWGQGGFLAIKTTLRT